MTNEFRELTERLAMGMNRDDHFAILITGCEDEDDINFQVSATTKDILVAIFTFIKHNFDIFNAQESEFLCEGLKDLIAEYEQRRFNEKDIEE